MFCMFCKTNFSRVLLFFIHKQTTKILFDVIYIIYDIPLYRLYHLWRQYSCFLFEFFHIWYKIYQQQVKRFYVQFRIIRLINFPLVSMELLISKVTLEQGAEGTLSLFKVKFWNSGLGSFSIMSIVAFPSKFGIQGTNGKRLWLI